MNERDFLEALKAQGFELSEHQQWQFKRYFELLVEWNEKINLTAVIEQDEVYLKHFYDSVTPLFHVEIDEGGRLCDVGAGAGFPSIPMKILRPDLIVTIVDSLNKRLVFLNELTAELGMDNIHLVHDRAETFGQHQGRHMFDYVTARAVANMQVLLELCLPLIKTGGKFIVLKGKKGQEEIDESTFALDLLGGAVEKSHYFELPSEDSERFIFEIAKKHKTPKKYPRKPGTPNKSPLQ